MNDFQKKIWAAIFAKSLSDQANMSNLNHGNLIFMAIDRANEVIKMLDYNKLVDHPWGTEESHLVLQAINGLDK